MGNIWKYLIVGVLAFVLGSSAVVSAVVVEKRALTNGDGSRDVAVTQKGQLALFTTGKMRMSIANPEAIKGPTGPQGPEGPPGGLGTHHFVVGGEAFLPWDDTLPYKNGGVGGGAYLKNIAGTLAAPVHLPHEAVVTSVKAYFNDTSVGVITVTLSRLNSAVGGYSQMADFNSVGINGYGNKTDSTITLATIDNVNYSYLVQVYSPAWSSAIKIMGVVITYTVS